MWTGGIYKCTLLCVSVSNQLGNRARLLRTQRNVQQLRQLERAGRLLRAEKHPPLASPFAPAFAEQLRTQANEVQGRLRRKVAAANLSDTLGTLTGARKAGLVRRQGPPETVASTLRVNSAGEVWDDRLGRMRKARTAELNDEALAKAGFPPEPVKRGKRK